MNFIKAHLRWIIYPLVILAFPLAWYAQFYFDFQTKQIPYQMMDEQVAEYMAQTEREIKAYEAAERADTYGGTTPQETWSMFVQALEAGDTDLAAKYFVQKKQEEMRRDLSIGYKTNKLEGLINDFKTIEEERMLPSGNHFMYLTKSVPIEGIEGIDALPFTYELEKSPISGLWKISSL